MGDGWFGRGDAGAVGVLVAHHQGADQARVPAGPHGRRGRALPRRPARAGAAQTGWMRAEAAGDPGPWRQQALLDRSRWEADALRDLVRDDALETLAEPDAVLVIDKPPVAGNAEAIAAGLKE